MSTDLTQAILSGSRSLLHSGKFAFDCILLTVLVATPKRLAKSACVIGLLNVSPSCFSRFDCPCTPGGNSSSMSVEPLVDAIASVKSKASVSLTK